MRRLAERWMEKLTMASVTRDRFATQPNRPTSPRRVSFTSDRPRSSGQETTTDVGIIEIFNRQSPDNQRVVLLITEEHNWGGERQDKCFSEIRDKQPVFEVQTNIHLYSP